MKQSTASKTLLGIITILTVMMALIVPSPAYAANEPPPPKPAPSNDTGGQGKPSHSSVKDLPADTTVVVTDNGTPLSLASQLTVEALSGPSSEGSPTPTYYVKFCASNNSAFGCKSYTTIQSAINDVANIKNADASGTFYVAVNYTPSIILKNVPIVLDQTNFQVPNGTDSLDLAMHGGSNLTTDTWNTSTPTTLIQPFSIKNINDNSSFDLDNFVFTIGTLLLPQDAVSVSNSSHVTLENLTVNDSNYGGSGISIDQSKDITLDNVTVNRSGGEYGDGIKIKDSGSPVVADVSASTLSSGGPITLTNVTVANTNPLLGDGLHITGSQDISMDKVSASSTNLYGAYLEDNSEGLVIKNSTFDNSGYAGLYVTGQDGLVYLNNVTADNNGKNVLDTALTPLKFLLPGTASGAAFMNDDGALIIEDSEFNGNATAGLWVQNQMGGASPEDASAADGGGSGGFVLVNGVDANGNGVSPATHTVPIVGTIFDYLGWSGGSFIDSDSGDVVVKDSNFGSNTGTGLEVYATGGDLILKDVTANENSGKGATLNTYMDLTDGTDTGSGKIIIAGDALADAAQIVDGEAFTSQFNGNTGPGLLAFAGGFAGVFNTEVNENQNTTNNFLVDIALGLGKVPPLESLLLNPGGAFVYSASPDTVVVGNSDFIGNNGEGLAVMTPGDIIVHDVTGSYNDGMGAFLDNCLLQLSIQCSGMGTISVVNGEFDANSYAGLVALASGADISTEDVGNSFYQGIYLDEVGANGNQKYGALLVSPADVEVTNSTFNGVADVSATLIPTYQQGLGLGVLSSGNVILASYEDLFGPESLSIPEEDFGVQAEDNAKAGGEILGLGSMAGLGDGSLFSSVTIDGNSVNGLALIGDSKFVGNGADGLTVLATLGIGVNDSIFAGNGGNGLTALSLGDIYLNDSGFFRNQGAGASAISVLGDIGVDPSIFAGNGGNGLTALALAGDIYLEDSGFYRNGGDGAAIVSVLGSLDVEGDNFLRNGGNGLTALSLGDIYLTDVFAGANGDNGAFLLSGLGDVTVFNGVFGNPFDESDTPSKSYGNGENGLVATTLVGDITLGGSEVDAAQSLYGEVDANQNGANGILATSLLGDINAENVYADQNGAIGAMLTSVLGSVDVQYSGFDANGGAGLVGLGLQNVFVGWSEAAGNQYAGALLGSLGDVVVTNSDFLGTSYWYEAYTQMLGLGVLGGDVYLDSTQYLPDSLQGSASGLVDDEGYGVNASGNGLMGALVLSSGDIQIGDSYFDENGASVASLPLLNLLGDGLVAVGGLGDDGATTLYNTEANGNTSFGAVLFNTDLVGAYDSTFDNNGVGGLLGMSFGDFELGDVDASTNGLLGAVTLAGGYTSVNDSMFDGNGVVGLLSMGLGPIWAENVDASENGILGAGLVSVNLWDVIPFGEVSSPCSDNAGSGDICVDNLTANDNGFLGAAILGTESVEVDDSTFTGNDFLGSLDLGPLEIPGGGLVVVGGESTVLDEVTADENLGFGAVVGNAGGVYDVLADMLADSNANAGAFSQAVGGPSAMFDLGDLPLFTETGDITITDSSFSKNDSFGLLAVSNGDVSLDHVKANKNGGYGASILAEGNVSIVDDSSFNGNKEFGLYVSIFAPEATSAISVIHTVTLDDITANGNGEYGAEVEANTPDKVDVSVNDGAFNNNKGAGTGGVGIFTTGDVFLNHVVGNGNAGDGAVIDTLNGTVTIQNSRFNYNDKYGLVIHSLATTITDTNVCYNKLGPDEITTGSLFTSHFRENCAAASGAGPTEQINNLPWQIIKVYTDTGRNSGTLSCQFGTTYLYLEKKTPPTPDFEWARAVLTPCIVPGGSVGTFVALAEGALPAPLPDGITFQGKAFDLSIAGPNGQPINVLGGPMMVRFTLPDGFTLPAGKKLDILWFDPAAKKWVELTTYVSGMYAWGYAADDGTFALTIK